MNKIIFLISAALCLASSGSLYVGKGHAMYEHNIMPNHMVTLGQMSQQQLLQQKFVLDILFNLQDRLYDVEMLMSEYGIEQISAIRPEMCTREIDESMRYMMDICNRCVQANMADMYSLSYTEELKQIMGLYRLFVTASDFQYLQQMAMLARKCVNSRIFAFAFMAAIRDRQDTHMIIIPKMYEIMPEMYYSELDMEDMRHFEHKQEVEGVSMDQHIPSGYLEKPYLWMPFHGIRKQIILQKMLGKLPYVPMPVDMYMNMNMDMSINKKLVTLENRMKNMGNVELFMGDLDLRAYVDSLVCHMMRMMGQDLKDVQLKNEQEMRMRDYMQENNMHRFGMGVSNAMSRMNKMHKMNTAHELYKGDMEYGREHSEDQMSVRKGLYHTIFGNNYEQYMHDEMNHELPTRDINDERLLHVGRRHKDYYMNQDSSMSMNNYDYLQHYNMYQKYGIKEAHAVQNSDIVDAADPRGAEPLDYHKELRSPNYEENYDMRGMRHPYSYYLQQQYNNMQSQMQMSSKRMHDYDDNMYGMRHRRSAEFKDDEMYQSGLILLHNIRQLMARIRMERLAMGEHEQMMSNMQKMDMSNVHDDLDRMRVIRLNKMGLDTRQSRMLLDYFYEMEKIIHMSIENEMQMQRENGNEHMNVDRMILNILMGRIQGVSLMQMFDRMQHDIMQQNSGQYNTQMNIMKRRTHEAMMMHFLARMDYLMQMYDQKYEQHHDLNDLMVPSVTITDLKVDKLRTFIDYRDDDFVNMMHCKNMKACMDEGKIMYARQPRLNHKSFHIKMKMNSEREQDVIMRIFLAPRTNMDFILMDTHLLKLHQGQNSIDHKSTDIMWTMKDTTSYSQLYEDVMLAMKNQYQPKLHQIVNQHCRFPHHLLLPRGQVNGLPMRLMIVVSSIDDSNILMEQDHMMCAMGMGNIGMDAKFYDFRMNRYIKGTHDIDQMMNMPNIAAQDVLIYHA